MSTKSASTSGGKSSERPDVDAAVEHAPGNAARGARRPARDEELVAQRGDPPAHLGPREALDLALELVDPLVEGVEQLEKGVRRVVDDGVHDLARRRLGVDAGGDPVDRSEISARPGLADRDERVGRRQHVDLEVLDAVAERRHARAREHGQHVGAVGLEQRSGVARVRRGRGEHLHRVRVETGRDGAEDLLVRRVDQIGPGHRHRRRG